MRLAGCDALLNPQDKQYKGGKCLMFDLNRLNDDEFKGSLDRLPTAQLLLSNGNKKTTGLENQTPILFIRKSSIKLSGWKSDSYGIPYNHQFRSASKDVEEGIAFDALSMNVIAKSPRFIELTQKGSDAGVGSRGQIIGNFDTPEGQSIRSSMPKDYTSLRTIYMIVLLDEEQNFLHRMPIALSVKGGAAYHFGTALEDFYSSLSAAYSGSKYAKDGITILNEKAKALGVFNCELSIATVGDETASADVPSVGSWSEPTPDKIEVFFNSRNADAIFSLLNSIAGFDEKYFKQFEEFHPMGSKITQLPRANNVIRELSLVPGINEDPIDF